jgi:hypothetical protein
VLEVCSASIVGFNSVLWAREDIILSSQPIPEFCQISHLLVSRKFRFKFAIFSSLCIYYNIGGGDCQGLGCQENVSLMFPATKGQHLAAGEATLSQIMWRNNLSFIFSLL